MSGLVIVAAQSKAIRGNLDENIAGHLRLIRAAASFGADLIVFPELSLTGYELDLARELQPKPKPEDPRHEPLLHVVRECGLHGTGNTTSAGKSAIWDERGQLLAQAGAGGEALVFARRTKGKWCGAVYTGPEFPEASCDRPGLP